MDNISCKYCDRYKQVTKTATTYTDTIDILLCNTFIMIIFVQNLKKHFVEKKFSSITNFRVWYVLIFIILDSE